MIPLAHMGGLDEMAWLVLPPVVFALVYRLVRGRDDVEGREAEGDER
jgi:hypothetical protein